MDAQTTEARVGDFETREALIEAIVAEAVKQDREIAAKFDEPFLDELELRGHVMDYMAAVDEGSQRLDRERRIEDVPTDVIDFRIDRAWETELD